MNKLLAALTGAGALAASAFALAQDGNRSDTSQSVGEPVLVELFTSQGCSSCPPADALASRVKQEAGLVVISRPVTYWDRLGWKDTLAREENTLLQRSYAARGLGGRNGVYTPQMVVNGSIGFVGSSERDLRLSIKKARATASAVIRLRQLENGSWQVGLGGKARRGAELMLLAVSDHVNVAIDRGENGGRKIGYTNVLRDEVRLANWSGGGQSLTVTASQLKTSGADRYALVLREPGGGRVLASAWLR